MNIEAGLIKDQQTVVDTLAYVITFQGSNAVTPIGRSRLPFLANFFIGDDPAGWRTGVRAYNEVVYQNLFDGIDLVYRPTESGIKYEFVLEAGAEVERIRMVYDGIQAVEVDEGGLLLRTSLGSVRDAMPYSFQGEDEEIECHYRILAVFESGFSCDARDVSRKLTIDPVIFSTFLGGSSDEENTAISVDSSNNSYVTGMTYSPNFPITAGAFSTVKQLSNDVFVTKLNANGTALTFSTFIGGDGSDAGKSLFVDPSGNVYLTGQTYSTDFPTTLFTYDVSHNGDLDAFIVKLNASGSSLIYSTFLGGSGIDSGESIVADSSGRAYVTGYTYSSDFPVTPGVHDTTFNGARDAFVTRLRANGDSLDYSTYLGGSSFEVGKSIAVNSGGTAYVTGSTSSGDFPMAGMAIDMTLNSTDAFVTRLTSTGNTLLYSTFLGGALSESGESIKIDQLGNIYVAGSTESMDFPVTPTAFDSTWNGEYDAYVTKLGPAGNVLIFSTFLGGNLNESCRSLAIDTAGNVYVTGYTFSYDYPTTIGAFDQSHNGPLADVFVTKVNASGASLLHSAFLGGNRGDFGYGIDADDAGNAYVTGNTMSFDFPVTTGSYDVTRNGGFFDSFVTKIGPVVLFDPPDLTLFSYEIVFVPPSPVAPGTNVRVNSTIRNIGGSNASLITVRFYDGVPSPSNQIGSDQVVNFLPFFFGVDIVWVYWTANPPGPHDICVVVDPDNAINESKEDNNQACRAVDVVSPPEPDLMVQPSDIILAPSPPFDEGSVVTVNATVRNVGGGASGATVARFHDGIPPSVQIDTDQPVPPLAGGGLASASVQWTASPAGTHDLCVVVDPDDVVVEADEANNIACVQVFVNAVQMTKPDYVPSQPLPLPLVKVGLSSQLMLSVRVLNQGNGTAMNDTTVAFFEPPFSPFSTSVLTPLAPAATSSRFTAIWTSPATPGTYTVSVDVDYYDNVTEWDEANNVYTWTIEVVSGPVTSLVVGSPNYTSTATYIKSTTPLDLSVLDQGGMGIRYTTYRVDNATWENYTATGTFYLSGEGDRYVEWYSEDNAGNVESVTAAVLRVDDTPPSTALSIGDPKYTVGGNYVKSSTPITLQAVDGGTTPVGLDHVEYQIDARGWGVYSSPFTLAGEGTHTVEYRSTDRLTNEETPDSIQIVVDDTPPITTISPDTGDFDLTTTFTLIATDGGSGVKVTRYGVDGGTPTDYSTGFTLPEGQHNVSYYSIDNLDNTEQERTLAVTVRGPPSQNTPPAVTLASPVGGEELVKGSAHTITWTMHDDEDANANLTVYLNYTSGGTTVSMVAAVKGIESFLWTLPDIEASDVVVNVTVIDSGGLRGWDESGPFTIKAPPPPPGVEANYKPIVALVFAIILAVVGLWSSRRRPWRGGEGRTAVARAFMTASMPFVLAEAGTGFVSLLTGQLSIPPSIGAGTAVDLIVFVSGLVVAAFWVKRRDTGVDQEE